MSYISSNIRCLRNTSNCTQEKLAEFLGVSKQDLAKVESGNKELTTDELEKVSALFCISPEDIEYKKIVEQKSATNFSEMPKKELDAIAAVNRIHLNSEKMAELLRKEKNNGSNY